MLFTKEEFKNNSVELIVSELKKEIPIFEESEYLSWVSTISSLKELVKDISLNYVVILEQKLPFSLKRIDAAICYNNNDSYHLDILEFKQWGNDNIVKTENNNVYLNFDKEPREHPFYQVNQYYDMLEYSFGNFDKIFSSNRLFVVLPNYILEKDNFLLSVNIEGLSVEPIIISQEKFEYEAPFNVVMNEHIPTRSNPFDLLIYQNDSDLIDRIFNFKDFKLYGGENEIVKLATKSINNNVDVIIKGYAGSGKTAIGLYLLNRLLHNENSSWNYIYASASEIKAYFSSKFKDGKESLFKVFGHAISNVQNNTVLLLDEAHRMYNNQVDELIRTKKNKNLRIIWMMDDYQSFSINEDNTTVTLKQKYNDKEIDINEFEIQDTQFRYSDRRDYIPTILKMLEGVQFKNTNKNIIISDSIKESMDWYEKASLTKGIIASDSWTAGRIIIDEFIIDSIKQFGLWSKLDNASNPASAYKCQGNSKDNILFIWGEEYVYRNDKGWIIQPQFVKEKKWSYYLNNFNKLNNNEKKYIHEKFRNLYYVLMSRYNISMNVFCVDIETREYLKKIFSKLD